MADADKKIRESIDERVYPGAPSQGADGGAETSDGAPGASRSQLLARAVLAVSLVLVIGSGAYFALRPSPAPEVQQAGSAVVAADVDDADDARADDEMGSSDADPERGDGAKASASTGGGADKADGSSGGSAAPAEGAQGQSAAHSGSSGSSGSSDGQAASKPGSQQVGIGSSGQQAASPQAPATIGVNVTVDSSSVGGSVSANTTVALAPSSTAYDALCATGLSVNSAIRPSVYVAGIGGLSGSTTVEAAGSTGQRHVPNHSASVHELHDGDSVVWVYVTG
ncbi:MAG: hypothetical protein ACLT5H_09660 [Collinsella stercoris]|uniref:hypothetical protein n=1 Tax=Collinsella stercoris TaxID=147206 RepID=UPI00399232CE